MWLLVGAVTLSAPVLIPFNLPTSPLAASQLFDSRVTELTRQLEAAERARSEEVRGGAREH